MEHPSLGHIHPGDRPSPGASLPPGIPHGRIPPSIRGACGVSRGIFCAAKLIGGGGFSVLPPTPVLLCRPAPFPAVPVPFPSPAAPLTRPAVPLARSAGPFAGTPVPVASAAAPLAGTPQPVAGPTTPFASPRPLPVPCPAASVTGATFQPVARPTAPVTGAATLPVTGLGVTAPVAR